MLGHIKLFADGADLNSVRDLMDNTRIAGYTTNPSLLKKAGITNYAAFAEEFLRFTKDRPVSFEVLADEPNEIRRQAELIASWGSHVYVKIPVMLTNGTMLTSLIHDLSCVANIKINVTAVFSLAQVIAVRHALGDDGAPAVVSVFAGRIADTGRDPFAHMLKCSEQLAGSRAELLWASPRQAFDIVQAERAGCDIITITKDLLDKKVRLFDKDLTVYSRETVVQFYLDAQAAGLTL